MKKISRILLLISFYYLISCNYDLYENHFSIFFNKARNVKNEDQSFGDQQLNNLFYSNVYTGIKFGNNKKAINLFLSFDNSDIKIIPKPNNISIKPQEKEKFYFPKAKQELNLTFILDQPNKEKINNNSYLGLSLYDNDKNKKSFINQLKENKIIKKRIFSILYKDNSIGDDLTYDGEILFGLYPHEMTSRYSENDLYWVPVINNSWKIKFDIINFNNDEKIIDSNEVEFDIGNNLNIGPEIYREKIYEKYFKKFIERKICKEEVFYNYKEKQFFLAYSCNHDLEIDEMPTLSFYSKELNYSITMDYNQLLCVYEGVIYFKFVFKKNKENKKWILGRSFMELYPLVFDADNKRIGFYYVEITGDKPIVLSLLFFTVIILAGIFIYRGNKMVKEENMKKEKENKEKKETKEIKSDTRKDNNINEEKSKLKNE